MNKFEIILFSLVFVVCSTISGFSQGTPPGDEEVPIDGGITLLVSAAALWGIKKIRSNKE